MEMPSGSEQTISEATAGELRAPEQYAPGISEMAEGLANWRSHEHPDTRGRAAHPDLGEWIAQLG